MFLACLYCRSEIPTERAGFLMDTGRPLVCVSCSAERPTMALMEYGHKTAGYLVIVPRGEEGRALRAYKRSR
jgi:hypothetical protein